MVMTQVVRSNNTKLIGICNAIRYWIFDDNKTPDFRSYGSTKTTIYNDSKKWLNRATKYFKNKDNKKYYDNTIILTWTNARSKFYNDTIRFNILKKSSLNSFEENDILIFNDFYFTNAKRFYSCDQVKVVKVKPYLHDCLPFKPILDKSSKELLFVSTTLKNMYRDVLNNINESISGEYKGYKINVLSKTGDEFIVPIYVIDKKNIKKLQSDRAFIEKELKKLIKYLSRNKSQFMKSNISTNEFIKLLWNQYNKVFVEFFADVVIAFSITCHKSQASTFKNVFVDFTDIKMNSKLLEMKKCFYTACTRASRSVYILA
jgi:hypothetical protein